MTNSLGELLTVVYEGLEEAHGYQGWWPLISRAGGVGHDAEGYRTSPGVAERLDDRDRLEIAIGAVLTQNTAWTNASAALASLRRAGLLRHDAISRTPVGELATVIRSSGYFNQKARKINTLSGYLGARSAGGDSRRRRPLASSPPRRELLGLWGIGPETADSILLYAYGEPHFVVDAYARRILRRLGAVRDEPSYEVLQERIHEALPPDRESYGEYHALFVRHARRYCRARPLCGDCPLREICAFPGAGQVRESPES